MLLQYMWKTREVMGKIMQEHYYIILYEKRHIYQHFITLSFDAVPVYHNF